MSQTKDVSNWQEFEDFLPGLAPPPYKGGIDFNPPLLFRGQSRSKWKLETTLERADRNFTSLLEYYRLMQRLHPAIASLVEKRWIISSFGEISDLIRDYDPLSLRIQGAGIPNYSYMAYLRHHGFPSPLLDWTRSHYIAAYFAFREAVDEPVSIYILRETSQGIKARSAEPGIYRLGQYVETDRRHFLQQSDYTTCLAYDQYWRFASHEAVFDYPIAEQDNVWKVIFPLNQRRPVLALLDSMNINAFSLLGSEDSLLETLAVRRFQLDSLADIDITDTVELGL